MPVFNIANKNQTSESLLSVLDDKNRMISSLKKQLQNQKMQLTYYMNRELSWNKIQQFSESVSNGIIWIFLANNLWMCAQFLHVEINWTQFFNLLRKKCILQTLINAFFFIFLSQQKILNKFSSGAGRL